MGKLRTDGNFVRTGTSYGRELRTDGRLAFVGLNCQCASRQARIRSEDAPSARCAGERTAALTCVRGDLVVLPGVTLRGSGSGSCGGCGITLRGIRGRGSSPRVASWRRGPAAPAAAARRDPWRPLLRLARAEAAPLLLSHCAEEERRQQGEPRICFCFYGDWEELFSPPEEMTTSCREVRIRTRVVSAQRHASPPTRPPRWVRCNRGGRGDQGYVPLDPFRNTFPPNRH